MSASHLAAGSRGRLSPLAIALVLSFAGAVFAGSIFDDDYTPPAPVHSPSAPALPDAPPPASVPRETPPDSDQRPVSPNPSHATDSIPSDAPAATTRKAVPSKHDQAKSRALMKDVYVKELADRTPSGRKALGEKLIDQAAKSGDSPSDQFVLLFGAVQAGEEAAELPVCFRAAEQLGETYEVEAAPILRDAALKMTFKPGSSADISDNLNIGLGLLDRFLESDDFDSATRLVKELQSLAQKDPAMRATLLERKKQVDSQRAAQQKYADGMSKLKGLPDDPGSNLAVGSYLAFGRGRWEDGLRLLAKGSDASLKQLAAQELAGPTTPEAQLALAEAWSSATEKIRSDAWLARAARRRAIVWYRLSLSNLTGLEKLKAQTNLSRAASLELGPPVTWKFVFEPATEGKRCIFSLNDPAVPDELKLTETPGQIRIWGTKKCDVAQIAGRLCGHFGKAFVFNAKAAQGLMTAAVSSDEARTKYMIFLEDLNGSMMVTVVLLKQGENYTWRLERSGETIAFTVTGANGDVGSIQLPSSEYEAFGFAASTRNPGDTADLTIQIQ